MNDKQIALIGGMGEGLGSGVANFFAAQGYKVIGLNRSSNSQVGTEIIQMKVDLSEQQQVAQAIEEITENHGVPDVFIHTAAELLIAPLEKTSAAQFEQCWRSGTMSAFLLSKELFPKMAEKGGTAIFTGATASIRGGKQFCAFSAAKFALRGLVQSLARQYQSSGLHVVHVIVDGIIDTAKSRTLHSLPAEEMLKSGDIAECFWRITQQPKSTWTQELDLRPYSEIF
jgi:NAD(P)-dependent dehydrogenase (short-subunit alcohol dehydrogenase family)